MGLKIAELCPCIDIYQDYQTNKSEFDVLRYAFIRLLKLISKRGASKSGSARGSILAEINY